MEKGAHLRALRSFGWGSSSVAWLGVALALAVAMAAPRVAASSGGRITKSARIPTGYAEMVRRWHAPPPTPPALGPSGRPLLVFEVLNTSERVELAPLRDDGGFADEDVERASHALRDPRNDEECGIDPRVLDLAYRIENHFKAKAVRIVSAFRMPHGRSNHGKGRALDIVVPGTRDDDLARFARTLGFVGVGLYPRSGFVHLDSRPRSFFWVDRSGPGQRNRTVPILPKLAQNSDAEARARGEAAPSDGEEAESEEPSDAPDEGRAR